MWDRLLKVVAGPLIDYAIKGARTVITKVIGSVADGLRTRKFNQLNARIDELQAELRHKPRINKNEAISIARRINDIRKRV